MTRLAPVAAILMVGAWGGLLPPLAAAPAEKGSLRLRVPAELRLRFRGPLGDRLARNIDSWLLPAPASNPGMLGMFRVRDRKPIPSIVPWAGEFAGKYLISAVQALRMCERPDLEDHVRGFVRDLVGTQATDGYLGPFPEQERLLGNWDLWGHYHVMQGLLLWEGWDGDASSFEASRRAADLIAATYLGGNRRVFDAGSHEMNMAVIHVLGCLYRRTGEDRYLQLIRQIEKDWERAGDYFRAGLAGVDFYRTPLPRWESLHGVQGLVELYRITGDERYRMAFANLWRSIARRDRHNTGGFSTGEQAVGEPYSAGAIETCCTVAWVALGVDMLHLTADPIAADELELSTWNAVLGAQHPSGRWWTYNTPMDGAREASAHTIVFQSRAGTPELNCCSVNGPRGLGLVSEWAVLEDDEGLVVAFYGPMEARLRLSSGPLVTIRQDTDYPAGGGRIDLLVEPVEPAEFSVRLRIPAWSTRTSATLLPAGGGPPSSLSPVPGEYLVVRRCWRSGDRVRLQLDTSLRAWSGDGAQAGRASLYRGPLLLAYDPVWNQVDEASIGPFDAGQVVGAAATALPPPAGSFPPILLVSVPLADGSKLVLSDFASACATGTACRSWLPVVNAPPPPVLLDRPRPGEALPAGKVSFAWGRGRRPAAVDAYDLLVVDAAAPSVPILVESTPRARMAVDLDTSRFVPGRDYSWSVRARNRHGESRSEARLFRIDPSLGLESAPPAEAPEPDATGVLVRAPLRGEPAPSYGLLQDLRGAEPAPGPSGDPGTALRLDGETGRVRYAIPWFPERDYSVAIRVSLRSFPRGRIGQVFSAWAGSMDDPLRITIDGGRVFARIEARGSFSTEGVEIAVDRWMHVAAVKAGNRLLLYVDGEVRSSGAVPEEVVSRAENVAVGGNPNYSGNESLDATLADFTLYARALSADEVRALSR